MMVFVSQVLGGLMFLLSVQGCNGGRSEEERKNPTPEPKEVVADASVTPDTAPQLRTGAEQTQVYVPLLKGKRVGMVVNQTSVIGGQTTVDSLRALGLNIVKIFGPEHGFRGNTSAGLSVKDEIDQKTGIKVVSLYGKHHRPTDADMSDLDIVIFDIQDVGVRFYTYINTLQYVMEACAANDKELIVLDRPNPNGYYVDGPVLEPQHVSGIGLKPIPIVHGLTVGEYAGMLNGEGWLDNKLKCKLKVIKVEGYTHDTPYDLPVKPSPNLNSRQAILLYPSTCLFEGTYLNHGRGTQYPFTVIGSPFLKGKYSFSFTPRSIKGMAETPIFQDQVCYGLDLRTYDVEEFRRTRKINLSWLMELYKASPNKQDFFNTKLSKQMGVIERLVGVSDFRRQIMEGKTEAEIRASWEPGLSRYKTMRKKYLLYP
ncbi:exo-beta-N-acetylmuramidase NamZ family protein [Pedobacter faecalis]|uniref:exo-beta-N-acetylmuramidase NamZ family protein n=1 Tax=Pedobacter faecalis TaxID=3041495 RepID=UPI00254F2F0F|nr:DUF1343 domain-containing protein [Pedobacter sp. ELA7]